MLRPMTIPLPRVQAPSVSPARLLGRMAFYSVLLLVAFMALFPIVWLLLGSIQTLQELYAGVTFWPKQPQVQNYAIGWNRGGFRMFLPNSLLYSLLTVIGVLLTASMAGYALARIDFPGRKAILFGILAIMIVPLPASFVALYMLLVNLGLANTRTGYVLCLIAGGLPLAIFILRGFFVNQPRELEEAAVLDGCSAFDVYWRVMLPLVKPGLAAVAVIQFLHAWNEYLLALVMFSTDALMPVQRGLTRFASTDTTDHQVMLAATVMAVLPVMVLYAIAQRSIIQGITDGAVKG